jgi:hypothetical protein
MKIWLVVVWIITGTVTTKIDRIMFINPFSEVVVADTAEKALMKIDDKFKDRESYTVESIKKVEE